MSTYVSKSFRVIHAPYDETDTTGSYKQRVKLECVYFSRMWILRFNEWFILNFYCLRPKEINLAALEITRSTNYLTSVIVKRNKNLNLLKRLKFLVSYLFIRKLNNRLYNF